jgi:hypothetical protein
MNISPFALGLMTSLLMSIASTAQASPDFSLPERVLAWGSNSHGQTIVPPVPGAGLLGKYTRVACGRWHSAAVTNDGQLVAWGRNDAGQCNVPTVVSPVANVSAGGFHTLALLDNGDVVAWGRNTDGQCDVPALPSGTVYVEVAAGGYHSVARRSDGEVVAWGQNHNGQCNVVPLPWYTTYTGIAAGLLHTVARRGDSKLKAWGSNGFGQCDVPVNPGGGNYTTEIACGLFHSMIRRNDGLIEAWGSNSDGQTEVPALPAGLTYTRMAAGAAHSVALRSDGSVVAWGRNVEGQCDVPTGVNFVWVYSGGNLTAGGNHTMARSNPPMASATSFGVGCPASQPLMLTSNLPILGTDWTLLASNLEAPAGNPIAAFVFGTEAIFPGVELSAIGAHGCKVFTNANLLTILGAPAAPGSSSVIAVPNSAALFGFTLTAQAAAPSSSTAAGFSTSNGLTAIVGY